MLSSINSIKIKAGLALISLLSLTVFFSVSVFPVAINYFFVIAFVSIALLGLLEKPFVDKKILGFFVFFLTPSVIAIFSLPPSMLLNSHGMNYAELAFIGRLFNLTIFFLTVILIHGFFKHKQAVVFFKYYWVGGFIFVTIQVVADSLSPTT